MKSSASEPGLRYKKEALDKVFSKCKSNFVRVHLRLYGVLYF